MEGPGSISHPIPHRAEVIREAVADLRSVCGSRLSLREMAGAPAAVRVEIRVEDIAAVAVEVTSINTNNEDS